ncbi:MAG: hypothetical protein KF691_02515 [Phycisphaeraceae bacterium]|nr:hypothetical protein [Phycisphaeraceae bacterium]
MSRVFVMRAAGAAGVAFAFSGAVASPYASSWTSYSAGSGASASYLDPSAAVGSPTRFTGVQFGFPSVVSPFSPPFDPGDIVSIGRGGHLTLTFDHDVYNRTTNAFGIDFIIFGNWFYTDNGNGVATGKFGNTGGIVEVSKDGSDWRTVNVLATSGYATLGYSDLVSPYDTSPGSVPTDFTKPVDPTFNAIGKSFAEIVAGYNGSGGGTGVDFASTGLDFIRFVRISNPEGNGGNINIDGIAEVPEPAALPLLAYACLIAPRRRRK